MAKTQGNTKTGLSLLERMVLPAIFQGKQSNFIGIRVIKDLKKKIEITQAEIKKYAIQVVPATGNIQYNNAGVNAIFRIDFTSLERDEIKSALKEMDKDKKLTEEFFTLYEKFVK